MEVLISTIKKNRILGIIYKLKIINSSIIQVQNTGHSRQMCQTYSMSADFSNGPDTIDRKNCYPDSCPKDKFQRTHVRLTVPRRSLA